MHQAIVAAATGKVFALAAYLKVKSKRTAGCPAALRSWEDFCAEPGSRKLPPKRQGLASGLTGDLAVGHAAEFGHGLAILDPVVVSACKVHFRFLSSRLRSG